MSSGRQLTWAEIDSVLDGALDAGLDPSRPLTPDDRALLERLCGHDRALQDEVSELLREMGVSGDVLEAPLTRLLPGLLRDIDRGEQPRGSDETKGAGRTLDRYRLIEPIGRGGMGVVYRAERADEQFDKQVALKLMPRGLESAERSRRFRRERQILAGLEHPGIARLLDGGMTEEGYPYLVMELVDGEPIDRYCERHELSIESRLELFLQVCEAVDYAHRNLVVHRDLKPGNCLVTPDGRVKLLDFGIAKILAEDTDEGERERTVLQPMTPQFASPEQLSNGSISTATDVYALGGLLYRLLCGAAPFDFDDLDSQQVRHMVLERSPPLASERWRSLSASRGRPSVAAERWRRRLRGDLDVIVAKALRRRPEERYASVAELALDLRRHLGGHPISARPVSSWTRLRKLAARHRATAAALLLLALLLGTGVTFIAWQGQAAARERDVARAEARRAQRIARFTAGLLEAGGVGSVGSGERTARELLDDAEARVRGELAADPLVRASMLQTMATSYLSFGEYEKAQGLVDEAIRDLEATAPDDEIALARLHIALANVRRSRGDLDGLEPLLQDVLDTLDDHDQLDSLDAAKAFGELGRLYSHTDRHEESLVHLRRSEEIYRQQGEPTQAAFEKSALAFALHSLGRLEESVRLHEEAADLMTRTLGVEHPYVATTRSNMALSLRALGRYEEAEVIYREGLHAAEARFGKTSSLLAPSLTNLARVLMDQGQATEAAPYARLAAEILDQSLEPEHRSRIGARMNLASVELALGNEERAIELYREGLELWIRLTGDDSHPTARTRSLLGSALARVGEYEEAEELLVLAIERQRLGVISDVYLAESLIGLARVHTGQDRCGEVPALIGEAVELFERTLPADHWRLAEARSLQQHCNENDTAPWPGTPSP